MRGLATLLVCAACTGGGPRRVGVSPSWRGGARSEPVAGPVVFAPTSAPTARYNEPVQLAPPSPLGDAVAAEVRAVAMKLGVRVPVADARLARACAELAEIVPAEGLLRYRLVEFAIQRSGIIEPSPHLLVVWGAIDSPSLILDQLRPQFDELLRDGTTTRIGIGAARRASDGTGAVVFALQASGVSTAPIPREVGAQGTIQIDAVVDARYREPEAFVTRDDGTTERLALGAGRPGGFVASIPCAGRRGRQQIEIAASDAAGATVLANFPVWCGAAAPRELTVDDREDPPAASPAEAERQLFASANRDRGAAGLPPLAWDDAVAAVARGYAEEMRRTRVVAHVSKLSGSAVDRVAAAQIKTSVVLENVARAYGVSEAHEGLMNSPGHRANLMSTAATRIGIGVVFGEEVSGRSELFIAQVFTRVTPKLEPAAAIAALRGKLVAARAGLAVSSPLAAIAQAAASELASGRSTDHAYALIQQRISAGATRRPRVGTVILTTADVESLDGRAMLAEAAGSQVGIGVAQGPHPELGEHAIWVVLLLADP